ncbi:hypothetical protein ACJ41O_012064 [Fusarium nematophilum]
MDRHAAECQSLLLAIRLQQQEILQWEAQRRSRHEPTSDADVAMQATAEELRRLSATVSDRMTSISLAQGRDPQADRAAADARCLVTLFEASLRDEYLFPPRCCGQPIPAEASSSVLTPLLIDRFNKKKVEYETVDKTYCHEPTCSAFVPPLSIKDKIALCGACNKETCVGCKGPSHKGECPKDAASQALLQLAKKNGWQQCKSCNRIVELDTGCFHMSKFHAHREDGAG